MKRVIISILICFPLVGMGQKKIIAQAKDYIKSGKNLDKAEVLMADLLKDSVSRKNEQVWLLLFEAQQKQYEQGNEKLYLKEKYDTAALFLMGRRMFATLEGLDSLEMIPDAKGRVRLKNREHSAEVLNQYRPNLFNGGVFFLKKQDFAHAFDFFDTYIACASKPMFARFRYGEWDKLMSQAAYWATYCGYKMQQPQLTLRHVYLALKDTAREVYLLQYLAEIYKLEKDTARYVQTLREGFEKFPTSPFFFPHLISYYGQENAYEKALETCNRALQVDSTNRIFRFAKGSLLLTMGRYQESLDINKALIADNDTLPDVYLNAGLALFNQAIELDKNVQVSQKARNRILDFYRNALPYLEKYRALAPQQKEKWALPLYTIYLNLNMGKQFDEIDKLL